MKLSDAGILRLLGHFLAQERDEIQAGWPSRVSAPLWERCICGTTLGAEDVERGQ